ncbi:MFS transporter [Kitasatospora sp. NPDC057738]|uniref:MFS transporter n=1 Tax=Kitasatospora sp. NPDC057738 TaxID=3346233 RepID=UPI0036AF229E
MGSGDDGGGAVEVEAAGGCLWWRRGRTRDGDAVLLDRDLLRTPGVRTAAMLAGTFYLCVTGSLFLLPPYLQQVRGMSPAASGLAVLPVSLAVAAAALVSGRLMRTPGPRPFLATGLLSPGRRRDMIRTHDPFPEVSLSSQPRCSLR